MLRDLLNKVSTGRFEDFGLMDITSADWENDNLVVKLAVQYDDTRDESREDWAITCLSVVEYLLSDGQRCGLNYWTGDHPALSQYSEPFESLYFGAKAADPDAFLGRMWAAHRKATDDWIAFDKYINSSMSIVRLVKSSSGLLADGPSFLVEQYANLLREEDMKPKRLASQSGTYAPNAKMIHFGDCFVIADEFEAQIVENE